MDAKYKRAMKNLRNEIAHEFGVDQMYDPNDLSNKGGRAVREMVQRMIEDHQRQYGQTSQDEYPQKPSV